MLQYLAYSSAHHISVCPSQSEILKKGFLYVGENRLGHSYKKIKVVRDLDKASIKQDYGDDDE